MKHMKVAGVVLAVLVLMLASGAGVYWYMSSQMAKEKAAMTEAGPEEFVESEEPLPLPEVPELEEGWLRYENSEYGFAISFPETYQALDDEENLYGWPNGVVLIYNGGQAYDIAIEAWDSEGEYLAMYPADNPNYDYQVEQIGDKYLTILDATKEEGNAEVIATFEVLGG